MSGITYPTRCEVIDAEGLGLGDGIVAATPRKSRPHIGKRGTADETPDGVLLTPDDGTTLWGWECWWTPLPGEAEE